MYGKVKISKRQIKEDKFTSFILKNKQTITENWQYLLIGLAIVVLVVFGINYYLSSQNQELIEASQNYSNALIDYNNGNAELALLSLDQILTDYAGTPVAQQANFSLAKFNMQSNNFAEAARYFQMYIDKYKADKLMLGSAYAGLAACQENQGNNVEAAANFIAAYNTLPDGPLASDYQFGAMRNYLLAGDIPQAQKRLDEIKELYDGTETANKAILLFAEKSK